MCGRRYRMKKYLRHIHEVEVGTVVRVPITGRVVTVTRISSACAHIRGESERREVVFRGPDGEPVRFFRQRSADERWSGGTEVVVVSDPPGSVSG